MEGYATTVGNPNHVATPQARLAGSLRAANTSILLIPSYSDPTFIHCGSQGQPSSTMTARSHDVSSAPSKHNKMEKC